MIEDNRSAMCGWVVFSLHIGWSPIWDIYKLKEVKKQASFVLVVKAKKFGKMERGEIKMDMSKDMYALNVRFASVEKIS